MPQTYGFEQTRERRIPELGAVLHEYTHAKSGARDVYKRQGLRLRGQHERRLAPVAGDGLAEQIALAHEPDVYKRQVRPAISVRAIDSTSAAPTQ